MSDILEEKFDWPEDYNHENGDYMNICYVCGRQFRGHKRRVVCRQCADDEQPEICVPQVLRDKAKIREVEEESKPVCKTCGGRKTVARPFRQTGYSLGEALVRDSCPDCGKDKR